MTAFNQIPDGYEPVQFNGIAEPASNHNAGKPKSKLTRVNSNAIMGMVFEPIRWTIPEYVSEGFSVLAGRQKLGKTWLGLDWAIAVACGGCAMGSIECIQGDVLYVDLENGPRRIQRRINAIFPQGAPDLARLDWATDAPLLDKGLIPAFDDWRRSVPKPRLIIIDVLARIKPVGNPARNSYENDYAIWAPLQKWATEHGIAVIGLHHTKKGGADDPLEALSGSNGLSACADTTLVLDRDTNGTTLYVRGRDIDEKETAMDFTAGLWSIKGEAADVRRSAERGNIAVTLEQATEPMSPSDLADVTGMKNGNIRKLLFQMSKAGEVKKTGRGRYVHPSKEAELSGGGNNGNKVTTRGWSDD